MTVIYSAGINVSSCSIKLTIFTKCIKQKKKLRSLFKILYYSRRARYILLGIIFCLLRIYSEPNFMEMF